MSVLDGPGEGTWSVFAAKVVEERDALRDHVESLKAQLECSQAFHNVALRERDLAITQLRHAEADADNLALSLRLFRDRALVDDRARIAAQILIAEVGAEGPMNVDDVAKAAAIFIRGQSARATRSMSKLAAVAKLLVANGCDCECEHHYEDHDDDCERCFACNVSDAIGSIDEGGSRAYERIP